MSELRIIRGRDIGILIDGVQIFGVTEFSVKESVGLHNVREFLSSKPVNRVGQGSKYEIKLCLMALFGIQVPGDREFSLAVREGGIDHVYTGCRVTGMRTGAQGNKNAAQTFWIEALSCEEQVTDDEQ